MVQYRLAANVAKEVSTYMQTLTRYLSNIMNSVLLGLPAEIKELIYFDALSHTGAMLLVSKRNAHKYFFQGSVGVCSFFTFTIVKYLPHQPNMKRNISDCSTSNVLQSLPMDQDVKRITPSAIVNLARDVKFLSDFVDSLSNPILQQNLDELQQTTALMQTDNPDEFYDVAQRNRKFGRVDPQAGAILLEK